MRRRSFLVHWITLIKKIGYSIFLKVISVTSLAVVQMCCSLLSAKFDLLLQFLDLLFHLMKFLLTVCSGFVALTE